MLDSHCHIDQYPSPETIVRECATAGIKTVAVTGLPSHYGIAMNYLQGQRTILPALGFHPLLVAKHPEEIRDFERMAEGCKFIGEVGIDGSAVGRVTLVQQIKTFERIVAAIADRRRFVTIHSRGAVDEVLEVLAKNAMYPTVFHWFSGTRKQLQAILDGGHSISINPAMIETIRWQKEILSVPLNRILTETDGPYSRTKRNVSKPWDVALVLDWLAERFQMKRFEVEAAVERNFEALY